ncbi:MAG: hypothetical protein PWP31_562 [Clostridia bacterium]|nr:hypothetical protein [Clostridia bacterium]
MKVGIIGAGAVGTGMGILLKRQGYEIVGVANRTLASAQRAATKLGCLAFEKLEQLTQEADLVFITTNDTSIGPVTAKVAEHNGFYPGQTVIHMSGSLTSAVLSPAKKAGAMVLSMHPLQSCADAEQAVENIPGSVFSLEGDSKALDLGKKLVNELGGKYFIIKKEEKPLYHAAACVASNYLVSLVDLSYKMMQVTGMEPDMFVQALSPLLDGTLNNIKKKGTVEALTGPISRGDTDTIKQHLKVMDEQVPDLKEFYQVLGQYTVNLASRKGTIDSEVEAQLLQLLDRN